jgi:hypothetical protein
MLHVLRILALSLPLGLVTGAVACGARQHIPLDAPQYEDPVGPGAPADAGATVPRS